MSLVVPNASEVTMLQLILTPTLTLKLYGNNIIPSETDIAATYTEIAGGGYVSKSLTFANWVFFTGTYGIAQYLIQSWLFTGAVNAPGTVYGYFVVRASDGLLMWAERFATAPVVPVVNTLIDITPILTAESLF